MLFLGKIDDILNSDYDNLYNVGLMTSNTLLTSECKDINYVQLNQGVYDEINMEVYDKDTTKNSIEDYTFPEIWHKYVVFHAAFNKHNLAAGNFDYMISDVSSMIIKKRVFNSTEEWLPIFEQKIYSETDSNEFNFMFTDYLVKNNVEYEYKLVPILTGGIEGFPIYAAYEDEDHKAVNFSGVFICEPNSVYSTILEVDVTAQKNKPSSIITTIGRKYPFVMCGTENNYYTGTVKGLFAPKIKKCEWDFKNSWDFREKFNNFLLDGKVKVLKYYDGRMWLVNIYDAVQNEKDEHIYKIITSFNWAEIGNITDVYSLYDNGFISYNPYTKTPDIVNDYDYSNVIYTGRIIDTDGSFLVSAEIKLYDNDGNVINTTLSNNTGQFSFSRLRDGEYSITVTAQGYISANINLSVSNHKVLVVSHIVMTKIQNAENLLPDNREYSISWTVLNSDADEFITGNTYDNNTLPASIANKSQYNIEIAFEAESFAVKETDTVYVSITGSYVKGNNVSNQVLENAGSSHCSVETYTGENNNRNTICSSTVQIHPSRMEGNNKYISSSSYANSDVSGDLKILISMESLENQGYTLYPIITSISVKINGINIFEMG